MALNPIDDAHLAQIKAGPVGRRRGHDFEKTLSSDLNTLDSTMDLVSPLSAQSRHLFRGHPAITLIRYIVNREGLDRIDSVQAWWLGGLATSGQGDRLLGEDGEAIGKSKSDVVVEISHSKGKLAAGISVKTCSKKTPTNDQLYFTTARAFCGLLRRHNIHVSDKAESAMRMFCGDIGYRPKDDPACPADRISDPDRWFYEELPEKGRSDLEDIFANRQREVTTILLQKAYAEDPFVPSYLLHQTVKYDQIHDCPMAIFAIEELVDLSCRYAGYELRSYRIRKGRFKHDPHTHQAPRFGYIQFQRAGNKQHPTQLQFNLQAAYFNKLPTD